jgi:hypothetical protein
MKTRTEKKISTTDLLNSLLYEEVFILVEKRIKELYNKKMQELNYASLKKELKVFKGQLVANGLMHTAIIGVKKKCELQQLLDLNTVQITQWKQSNTLIHLEVAITAPGKFFILSEGKRGRPGKEDFSLLSSPAKAVL